METGRVSPSYNASWSAPPCALRLIFSGIRPHYRGLVWGKEAGIGYLIPRLFRRDSPDVDDYTLSGLNTTIADGNGALFFAHPNLSRPLMNRISEANITSSCHHLVSVRLGMSITTVAPLSADRRPLRIHWPIVRPYGGLHHTTPSHSRSRLSLA